MNSFVPSEMSTLSGASSFDSYSASSDVPSDSNDIDDVNIHNESNVLEENIDVSENDLNEDCEEQPFVYEANPLLDWSADVGNYDIAEENEVEKHFVYEGNQVPDWSVDVESDNKEEEDEVDKLFVYEGNQVPDWSVDVESDNIEEEDEVDKLFVYEGNQVPDWSVDVESDNKEEEDEVDKLFVYEGNQVPDWSVDVESDNIEEEDEVEKQFVYEGNQVPDWSVDVESDNIEEEDDNSIKVNSSTISDKHPYQSPEVIKYLKEKLYLEALYGRTGFKECLPVADVLPIIYEESECVEEYDTLELNAEDLKEREEMILGGREKNIVSDVMFETPEPFIHTYALESAVEDVEQVEMNIGNRIEKDTETSLSLDTIQPFTDGFSLELAVKDSGQIKETILNPMEKDVASDLTVNTSKPFTENHSLESLVELFAQVKEETTNNIDKDLSSVPSFHSSQRNLSDNENLTTQGDEVFTNDNKFLIKETKLSSSKEDDFTSQTSAKKTDLSVENVLRSAEAGHIFNAVLQKPKIHQHEKENISKLQNDGIKIMKELIATDIEQLCSNRDILLNPSEEGDNRKEVIFNPIHSNLGIHTSTSIQETAPHGECLSEVIVEEKAESNGKVSSKKKKKKFQNFRKWLSSFCCCTRKKT